MRRTAAFSITPWRMAFAILAFYAVLAQAFASAATRPAMPVSGLPQHAYICFGNGVPSHLPAPAEACQCLAHCTGLGTQLLPTPAGALHPVRIALPASIPLPATQARDELNRPAHIRARGPPAIAFAIIT